MGKCSGFLLASDFDGTLADGEGKIPAFVRERLAFFIREGGLFTVCTGRSRQGFHAFDPALINAPVLVSNGMQAHDYAAGKTLFTESMSREDCAVLWTLADAFPTVGFEFYTPDFRTFTFRADDRSRRHLAGQEIGFTDLPSLSDVPFPLVKLMLSCGRETGQAVQRFLAETGPGPILPNPTHGEMVEFVRAGCGKGVGLLRLASLLGIDKDRVFAVGDGDNDLQLLGAAAVSFAPANACPEAKAAADVIVPSNDDGAVGYAVDRIAGILS